MLLASHGLSNRYTLQAGRSRHQARPILPGCCCRAAAVSVRCQARVKKAKKAAPRRLGYGRNKGFGGKPQADWEADLLPPYRVYYKQGYTPPRFQGSLAPTVFEGTSLLLVVSDRPSSQIFEHHNSTGQLPDCSLAALAL